MPNDVTRGGLTSQDRIDLALQYLESRAQTHEWAAKALVALTQILVPGREPMGADIAWAQEALVTIRAQCVVECVEEVRRGLMSSLRF